MKLQIALSIILSTTIICAGYFWVWLVVTLLCAKFITLSDCEELQEERRYGCPPDYHGYVVRQKLDEA